MSLFYRVAYWIGLRPWEDMARLRIATQIASLFDREERERQRPYGSALDVGCGTGIWTVVLAQRGWQVTGVELVAKAVREARRRVQAANVDARIVQGDLTSLQAAGVGSDFQLVVDFGAIHGLGDRQRQAAGREITAAAAGDATMLLLAWKPANRGPLPRGMSLASVQEALPAWRLLDDVAADVSGAPAFVQKAEPHFYRLRRA